MIFEEEKENNFENSAEFVEAQKESPETVKLQNENSILREKIARLSADFDNALRRADKEKNNFSRIIKTEIINKFLPTMDDMILAANALKSDPSLQGALDGVMLVLQNFEKTLKQLGVEEISTEMFDPEMHEAISQVQSEGKTSGTIITVLKKGFLFEGKVLRHAQVIVAC